MRKKHTEMTREFGLELIDNSIYGVMSFYNEEVKELYSIPMSFVRIDNNLYFHTGKLGKKVELLKDNLKVNVVFVENANTPEKLLVSQVEKIKEEEGSIGRIKSSVFTNEFSSVIVEGNVNIVKDEDLRTKAIYAICKKYTPKMEKFFDEAIGKCMDYTSLYEIKIEDLYARKKLVEL